MSLAIEINVNMSRAKEALLRYAACENSLAPIMPWSSCQISGIGKTGTGRIGANQLEAKGFDDRENSNGVRRPLELHTRHYGDLKDEIIRNTRVDDENGKIRV